MTLIKNAFLLSAVCALISVNAYPDAKKVIKEYITPPPSAEALPVNSIPPLFSSSSKTAPVAPLSATQNTSR